MAEQTDENTQIHTLKNEICILKHELDVTRAQNTMLMNKISEYEKMKLVNPIIFNEKDFERFPTVNYLAMCDLDEQAINTLFNMLHILDFSCVKYLIDCWDNGMYKWDRMFTDRKTGYCRALIHSVCSRGCERSIMYILNIYMKKDLDLRIVTSVGLTPLHILCYHDHSKIIHYVLDIYVERGWDLECVANNNGRTILMSMHNCSSVQLVKRVVNIYIERNYDLERVTTNKGPNCLHILCENGTMPIVKFIIDVFVKKKLRLNNSAYRTLDAIIRSNSRLNNKNVNILCMYLKSTCVQEFNMGTG